MGKGLHLRKTLKAKLLKITAVVERVCQDTSRSEMCEMLKTSKESRSDLLSDVSLLFNAGFHKHLLT